MAEPYHFWAPYPEHDKQRAIIDQSQAIGEFMDWLREKHGVFLAEHDPHWHPNSGCAVPVLTPITNHLADFFGIDLDKLEAEKVTMLERQRELYARTQ